MTLHELDTLSDTQLLHWFSKLRTKWVKCTIPAGKYERIVRCVVLRDAEEDVANASRISYCPSAYLADGVYNRCNLPKQEMFYGTLYGREGDVIKEALLTSIFEVSGLCHETSRQDEYYASGEWLVIRDLVSIVIFEPTQLARNSFFKDAEDTPQIYLAAHSGDEFGETALIEAFKREVKDNSQYRISANYSDYLFRNYPIDAIIYPSVRTGQVGTCIAIRPSFVDSGGLQLIKASKYRLYSTGEKKVAGYAFQRGHVDAETGSIQFENLVY
jgi:hypothetical protein